MEGGDGRSVEWRERAKREGVREVRGGEGEAEGEHLSGWVMTVMRAGEWPERRIDRG